MTELGIEHKTLPATLVARTRLNAKSRTDLRAALTGLAERIPAGAIAGPAFCLFQFITSYTEGFDVEVGFPLAGPVEVDGVQTRTRPAMQVLSRVHQGSVESLRDTCFRSTALPQSTASSPTNSARRFTRTPTIPRAARSSCTLSSTTGTACWTATWPASWATNRARRSWLGSQAIALESSIPERFEWTRAMVHQLDALADDDQRYEILSRCAHVFPVNQIAKLGVVFEHTRAQTGDPWQAVDAVIEFMIADPGWGVRPVRRGATVYAAKNPRDPQAYAQAQTDAERKRAYCFCPLIRDHLDGGMSDTFCYCSAGWERQQWEGAIGRSVRWTWSSRSSRATTCASSPSTCPRTCSGEAPAVSTLLLAPTGHGKTEYVLNRIRDVQADEPLAPVWVILPNQIQVRAFGRRFGASGGALGVETGHLLPLLRRDCWPVRPALRPPARGRSPPPAACAWWSDWPRQASLHHYAPLHNRPGFARLLRDLFQELKQARIQREAFEAAVADCPASPGRVGHPLHRLPGLAHPLRLDGCRGPGLAGRPGPGTRSGAGRRPAPAGRGRL